MDKIADKVTRADQIPAVTQAALEAGHSPTVQRKGTRFSLACSCGFKTPASMSRKHAFQAIADHVATVGRAAMRVNSGDTPGEVVTPTGAPR